LGDGSGRAAAPGQPRVSLTPLYYLDEAGKLAVTFVEKGLADRQSTVVRSPEVREGMQVIVAVGAGATAATAASNPFQAQNGGRPPGGGPPPM
jgi:hypothetical protein